MGGVNLPRYCFYQHPPSSECIDLVPVISGEFDGSLLNSLSQLERFELGGSYGSIKGVCRVECTSMSICLCSPRCSMFLAVASRSCISASVYYRVTTWSTFMTAACV